LLLGTKNDQVDGLFYMIVPERSPLTILYSHVRSISKSALDWSEVT